MKPGISEIQHLVGLAYGIEKPELCGPSRKRPVARARQIAMVLSRELTAASLPRIGKRFGRDHTTVIHARNAIDALTGHYPAVRAQVDLLRQILAADDLTLAFLRLRVQAALEVEETAAVETDNADARLWGPQGEKHDPWRRSRVVDELNRACGA